MSQRQTAARHSHVVDGECSICIKADHEGDAGLGTGRSALWSLAVTMGLLATAAMFAVARIEGLAALCVLASFVVSFGGFWRGYYSLREAESAPRPVDRLFAASVIGATFLNGLYLMYGAFVAYMMSFGFTRGRQLRQFGRVMLPDVRPGGAWADAASAVDVEEPARAGLAGQWRENGRTEHASVAAFARLTLDLMALGAPPQLLAAANQDALDEIRHTELCFSLARDLDGQVESPAPFPEARAARTLPAGRQSSLAALAVDSLVDGALNEGVSARVIAQLAKVCEEPRIRAMLKEIAADEGRHAAHGWTVVEWCLSEGGAPVASALRGAIRMLPDQLNSGLPSAAAEGAWERYGVPGRALEAAEFSRARASVIERVNRMVSESRPAVN